MTPAASVSDRHGLACYQAAVGFVAEPAGAPGPMIADVPDDRGLAKGAERADASSGVRSLRRGLEVLQAIADAGGEASLRELSKRLQLAESTVHGLLHTLVLSGHVVRTSERRYGLGHALIQLGEATNRKLGVQATAALQQVATLTGENADLAVLEGADAVYIAQAVMPGTTRSAREVERRLPARSTAAGRALLSQLTPTELKVFIQRHLPRADSLPQQLVTELADVRRRGYASEADEVEPGISCVAVPVAAGPIPLALTVTGPSDRLTAERMPALAPHLRRVAEQLASDLRRSLQA
jgi:IclR family acetate operon transcriptional repressor